jgi:hypothetical protein
MILGLRRARLVRMYFVAAAVLGSAAYVSGAVSADICHAYRSGSVAGDRPTLCA